MAHLLMVESWVGGTGRIFPASITSKGHRYTFVTRNRHHYHDRSSGLIHPVLEHADNVLTTETNDTAALIDVLSRQHDILKFDGVLTICDYYVETVVRVSEALNLPRVFSSNVSVERQKHLVRQAIERAGLPNPAFRVTTSWEEARRAAEVIGYPLILKPSDLASSAFVKLVSNEEELRAGFEALEAFTANFRGQKREQLFLLEEYMDGEEISVEACTLDGVTTVIGITDKSIVGSPYFIEDGHMFPAKLDGMASREAADYVVRALDAVGHDHGVSHTEVKLTSGGPRIVEINPRPGGNYIVELVQHVTGIDILEVQIDLALGRRPDLSPRETGVHSAAIKFLVPPHAGYLAALQGVESLDHDPNVVRHSIDQIEGKTVAAPIDNACYLGHVVTVDRAGPNARARAEEALGRIKMTFGQSVN